MKTGADCIVEGLQKAGVKTMFGLPGGSVLDVFDRLYSSPIEFILARHEQGATHMADGYARATGKIGCCLVTSGPGATNTVTGLATAHMDSVPLVCLAGQVPLSMIGNDAFQEADTTGITRAVTKHNYLVRDVGDLPRILAEAFHVAGTGRPGPVVVDIPKNIQQAQTKACFDGPVQIRGYRPSSTGHPKQIEKLAEAINKADRPLLYVGGGAIISDAAAEVTALARKARIPVTTTLLGLGAFPETDPLALRMLGMHGSVAANYATTGCDLLISAGARFDDRVTGKISEFAPDATIAHIDIDPSAISKNVQADIPVVGDLKLVLKELLKLVKPGKRTAWLKQIAAWQKQHPFTYRQDTTDLLPQFVIEQIYKITKGDAIVVTDVGQHQMWSAQFYKYTKPRTFLSSGGLGTMGYGMPAAIGAQAGCRNKTVVNIAGDGSIQMNFQELVVAVNNKLPINVVILNNGCLGMVRQWQEMFYGKRYSSTQLGRPSKRGKPGARGGYLPDFVKLAEAHGAVGIRVETREEVDPALRKAFDTDAPVVVECLVRQAENVYPMVPSGASLTEMIHSMA
ncbi:MAG: biosynthetic-type acetolactate synthase large subunit [Kiritimatiellae bacterium]|nr:biosynthetic-type acetolactate synthase large subunit [Kiritimatiellia bacterium]